MKSGMVKELINKLICQSKIALKHKAEYDWKRHCLRRDLTLNNN